MRGSGQWAEQGRVRPRIDSAAVLEGHTIARKMPGLRQRSQARAESGSKSGDMQEGVKKRDRKSVV